MVLENVPGSREAVKEALVGCGIPAEEAVAAHLFKGGYVLFSPADDIPSNM